MAKMITLEDETHRRLSILKANLGLTSFNMLINHLLKPDEIRQDEKDIGGTTEQ